MALRRSGKLPDNAHTTLNGVIIYLSLPALILLHLHDLRLSRELLYAAVMPWCLFLIGALFFFVAGKRMQLQLESRAALTLVGGLGNTSFVGIPMVEALHGKGGVPLAVIIDQVGTYLCLSTLGMLAVVLYTSKGASPSATVKKILTFPPFIAVFMALFLFRADYPPAVSQLLSRLSDTVAPLAILSVGCQMRLAGIGNHLRPLSLGLLYKLVLCPVIVLVAYLLLATPQEASQSHVILLEAAMGPQIGAGIVATQHNLDPELVVLMIGVGTVLALLTVPLWSILFLSF